MNNNNEYDQKLMSNLLSPSKKQTNNNDAITKILSASHDDDDSSYMHSIMERRRYIKPQKDDDEDEESVATNAPLLPVQRRKVATTSTRRGENRPRARSLRNNRSHTRQSKINPIVLIIILGLAANWVATRLLDGFIQTSMIDENVDAGSSSAQHPNNVETQERRVDDTTIITDNQAYQSEGERMIERLSLTKLSDREKLSELSDMRDRYEMILKENDIPNGGRTYNDYEMREKIQRLKMGIAMLKEELKATATNDEDGAMSESNAKEDEETKQQQSSSSLSPVSERFELLRKRLLPLYSEAVPTESIQQSITNSTHPLFNTQSPQFQALNWLSNIDKSQITDEDPHIVQRYALTVLYFATGGPPVDHNTDFSLKRRGGPWRNPTNFLTPNHECEWKSSVMKGEGRGGGIRRCDADKNVVELSIYNELTGTIPSELGRLSFLRTLYLGRNNLVGTIPTELGMIKPIASISLQYNQLTGEIPQNDLHRIPTLRFLQLEGNPLRGKIEKDGPLCQMRVDKTKKAEDNSEQKRLLRVLSATCSASESNEPIGDMLVCECCSKCFEKEKDGGY